MRTDFDALIVGAGPAGSSAAILLARAGWDVALIERQRFPRRKVCGECVAASNLGLLDALGIGAAFAATAGPDLRRAALLCGADSVVTELPAASDPRHRWGRALGRETLDTLLLAQAREAGVHVLQPWSVLALEGQAGDWRGRIRALDSGAVSTLRAPVAIAAHGSWELLPSARSERRVSRKDSDLFAFKASFRNAALPSGQLPVLAFDGGYGGMVVGDDGITTVACCIRRDRLDVCRDAASGARAGEVVEALLKRECHGVRDALRGAQCEGAWLAAGPLDPGVHLRPDDSVFRIGNAAGEAHPIIGEGISMALQSAWLLCAQLLDGARPGSRFEAQGWAAAVTRPSFDADAHDPSAAGVDAVAARAAPPDLRDAAWQRAVARRYAAEWRREFAPRLRLAAAFAHAAMRPVATVALFALVRRWPGLLTSGARWGGKVRCAVGPATIATLTSCALAQPPAAPRSRAPQRSASPPT